MKGVIYVDIDKCVACKTCEMACAVEHSKSKELCKAIYECPSPQGRVEVEAEAGRGDVKFLVKGEAEHEDGGVGADGDAVVGDDGEGGVFAAEGRSHHVLVRRLPEATC